MLCCGEGFFTEKNLPLSDFFGKGEVLLSFYDLHTVKILGNTYRDNNLGFSFGKLICKLLDFRVRINYN